MINSHDKGLALLISATLTIGVIVSGVIVVIGGVMFLRQHSGDVVHYGLFSGEPHNLRDLSGIWIDSLAGNSRGIIQLGLAILMTIPVLRVVLSIFGFVVERDWKFVAISSTVLCALLYSLFACAV